ncbi:MAG TPA: G1 family glutamic endopeptidase, partial [Acidimicrobiales bacterium]|nr:G1 family glutamic endopeptidase [Acidimicrobiales bacterium]
EEKDDTGFSQVSAQWTEPAVTCPKKDSWTLFWVGFDGWPSGEPATNLSVEQGGTSAQCVGGVPQYKAFYEMWPSNPVQTQFSISAGDQISASVVYSPTAYSYSTPFQITVTDVTTGQSFSTLQSCAAGLACARTSAEWIAESPARYGTKTTQWFPLANYGTVNFTDAQATNVLGDSGPISAPQWWDSSGIERIAGRSKPLAKVSTLESEYSGSASAFSDTWQRK